MNFAPCLDVNNNPRNPVIGVRSFGEDPQAVAALGTAAIKGYQEEGVSATAKHFPTWRYERRFTSWAGFSTA